MLSRALDFHDRNGNSSLFTHICFEELVRSPMDMLDTIYRHRGESIAPELREIFEITEKTNPREKYGRHAYSLEHFGLEARDVDGHTANYQRFQQAIKQKHMCTL
jgi:hypothetical protein